MDAPSDPTRGAIDAVFRIEWPGLIARLSRIVKDVGLAEELAQDAFLAALERWPATGVPDAPGAWLLATARNRAIDRVRRDHRLEERQEALGVGRARARAEAQERTVDEVDAALDDEPGDDLLRLVFTACHPLLSSEAQVALTLRLLGGLSAEEIARAFLVPEPTVAQRIVRAKKTLAEAQVPFEVPRGGELASRLGAVLQVIYLIFNEGHTATRGDDLMRPGLCEEALRLARVLVGLVPREPEAHGLLALMELTASRARARTGPNGEPILLLEQDRARWDRLQIARGLAALERAASLGGARGPYALQAAIAACHARALEPGATDWARIAALYGELNAVSPSPVIELNRAIAVAMAEGPAAGLALLDALVEEGALAGYHLLPAARGDLLQKLGRTAEARADFERAAAMTRNARERELLLARAGK